MAIVMGIGLGIGSIGLIGWKLYQRINSRGRGNREAENERDERTETPNSQTSPTLQDANFSRNYNLQQAEIDFETMPTFFKMISTRTENADFKAIFGLAVLNHDLFVLSQHSKEVEVYDAESLDFKHLFYLEDLYDPIDMKSCSKNNCLYIIDRRSESSEIIRVDSDGELISKWKTEDGGGYISVTTEANVLLSVWERSLLKEFTAEGKCLREIQLQSSITGLHLAIKMPNGGFLISQGEDEESEHSVSLVDDKGVVVKSIGGKKGSANGEFHCPSYMAVDGSGFVLVADQNNSRVVLLSPDLVYQTEVVEERAGLRYPVRMELDCTRGRLFVADNDYVEDQGGWRDGRIRAFDFKIRTSTEVT